MTCVFSDPEEILDSITVRKPQFMQKNLPIIAPKMQVAVSGKVRTYIERPVNRQITLTWDLLTDGDPCVMQSLLGLMAFKQIYMTLGTNYYYLTLLDDVYKVIHENQYSDRVVLNFEGRKV